jgi:uncharacterized protein YdhG (YjbR/CyaY superfamily)
VQFLAVYQLPAFRLNTMLVGFGATSKQCAHSLKSGTIVEMFREDLSLYHTSNCTDRFSSENPLPVGWIRKLDKARLAGNKDPEDKSADTRE